MIPTGREIELRIRWTEIKSVGNRDGEAGYIRRVKVGPGIFMGEVRGPQEKGFVPIYAIDKLLHFLKLDGLSEAEKFKWKNHRWCLPATEYYRYFWPYRRGEIFQYARSCVRIPSNPFRSRLETQNSLFDGPCTLKIQQNTFRSKKWTIHISESHGSNIT